MQQGILAVAALGLGALATGAASEAGGRGLLPAVLLGVVAGVALYHASFGFTGGWRRLLRERRTAGARAQLLLIGLAALVTYPLIGYEAATGWDMHPVILPMGIASAFGAALFGVGMQLGGGCASGTLFTAGGGSTRMLVTLAAFVAGSVIATHHLVEVWFRIDDVTGIPNIPGTSLIRGLGVPGALLALGALLAVLWLWLARIERQAHGDVQPVGGPSRWLTGPWSPAAGAVALALVSVGCFLAFSRPWGVTAGFALWGAKAAMALGIDPSGWGYWSGWRAGQLEASLMADRTSVMNAAIVLGAMAAAAAAGRFRPVLAISGRDLATAVIGGLMMGYGARLAFGCNIGAFLGGFVSGSLHGLWWLVWGFAGSALGVWLRARLAVDPPWPARSPA